MPRLQIVEPKSDTGPGADLLNGPLKEKQINIFKGLAVNPGVLKAFLAFSQGVKTGVLTPAEHEVIQLTAAQSRNCEYCTAAHTQIAKGLGIDEEQSRGIRQGIAVEPRHQALVDFTNAVIETNGFVSDAQLDGFRDAGFDDAAVIEVIAEIAVATFTNYYNHVNETEIDFPVPATA